jgi:hypothetical protein
MFARFFQGLLLGMLAGGLACAQPAGLEPDRSLKMQIAVMDFGTFERPAPCGGLQEFTTEPKRFDYSQKLAGTEADAFQASMRLAFVGRIGAYSFQEVIHTFERPSGGDFEQMKLTLATRGDGRYCQVLHVQTSERVDNFRFENSKILRVGDWQVLASKTPMSGEQGTYFASYLLVVGEEIVQTGWDRIARETAAGYVPAGCEAAHGEFDPQALRFHTPLYREGESRLHPGCGGLVVNFRLQGDALQVSSQKHYENYQTVLQLMGKK